MKKFILLKIRVNVDTNAEEIYSDFNTDVIDEGHVTNGRNYVFYIPDI